MRTFLFLCLMLAPTMLLAADPTPAPAPVPAVTPSPPKVKAAVPYSSDLDTNHDGVVDAAEAAAATSAPATTGDVIKNGSEVISAAQGLKDPTMPKSVLIAVLLGAIFKLLLSLLKVVANNMSWSWFASADGKRVIKYSTLGLGAVAALCANLAFGMGWMQALVLLISGPLAVAIHEYTSDSKPVPAPEAPKA